MKTTNKKVVTGLVIAIAVTSAGAAIAGKHNHRNHAMHSEFAAEFISKKLDLDANQEQALMVLRDQMKIASDTMHAEMQTSKSDSLALIESETFDQAKALEMITAKTGTVNAIAPDFVLALGGFLDTLNVEQKAQIVEFMDSRRGKRGRWMR